jgi:hypothetical protein
MLNGGVDCIDVLNVGKKGIHFGMPKGSVCIVHYNHELLEEENGNPLDKGSQKVAIHKDPIPMFRKNMVKGRTIGISWIDDPFAKLGKRLTRNHA